MLLAETLGGPGVLARPKEAPNTFKLMQVLFLGASVYCQPPPPRGSVCLAAGAGRT